MTPGTARLREMRELRDRGLSLREIGRRFGISHVRVLKLLRGAPEVVTLSASQGLTPTAPGR